MLINDVLRDCRPGRAQTVGVMQVIPLVSTVEYPEFVSPTMIKARTTRYGELHLRNLADKPTIVPAATAFITKQAAQDHALPSVKVVGSGAEVTDRTAACIQDSQGGYISSNKISIRLLPFMMREDTFRTRKLNNCTKLWDSLRAMNRGTHKHGPSGHLVTWFHSMERQLATFVAEFEPVPQQIGAIVLIGGKVVGIERVPSHNYWSAIWSLVIRDCYGSLAIVSGETAAQTRVPLDTENVHNLEDLETALDAAESLEKENTSAVVRSTLAESMTAEASDPVPEGSFDDLSVQDLVSGQFVGQTVCRGADVVYASLIATRARMMAKGSGQAFSI